VDFGGRQLRKNEDDFKMNGAKQDKILFWVIVGVGCIFLLSMAGKLFS
jgi:hypothetical protein